MSILWHFKIYRLSVATQLQTPLVYHCVVKAAMASATITFANLPELLLCLADVVQTRKQLANLRLVSKAFNAAATPCLFRHCRIAIDHHRSSDLKLPAELHCHVRKLVVARGYRGSLDRDTQNEYLQGLLLQLPLLESFEYVVPHHNRLAE